MLEKSMSLIDSDKNKEKILKKFLEISAIENCSEEILQKAIIESWFDPKLKDIFFENGLIDLFYFAFDLLNQEMLKEIAKIDLSNLGISGKIREFMKVRLELISKNYQSFRQIIFYLKHNPKSLAFSLKKSYQFADLAWYEIGDKSTDYNFYSKRILLSKIHLKTFSFFAKEKSADQALSYFDNQIKNILKFTKIKTEIKEIFSNIYSDNCGDNLTYGKEFVNKQFQKLPFIRLYYNGRK